MSFSQSIRGLSAPDPNDAEEAAPVVAHILQLTHPSVAYTTPRQIINDGTHIYVGQSTQPSGAVVSPVIFKLNVSGGTVSDTHTLDLSVSSPGVSEVRDLAQDATYLYATTFGDQHVAIIDKATLTVVGWANTSGFGSAYGVAANGTGNFYVAIQQGSVLEFQTSALLGQPPGNGVSPTQICNLSGAGRLIRYGGGKLWVTNGGSGGIPLYKIDPGTMTIDAQATDLSGDHWGMAVIFAFGFVWVTSGNTGVGVHQVNPADLSVVNTIAPTGGFSGVIAGITTGSNSSGSPNQWLYVTSRDTTKIGILDPAGPTWLSTVAGTTVNARYEGVTSIGNFTYFAGLIGTVGSVPTIDWTNRTAATNGALVAGAPVTRPILQFGPKGVPVPTMTTVVSNVAGTPQGSSDFVATGWQGNFAFSGGPCRIDASLAASSRASNPFGPVTFQVLVDGNPFGAPKTVYVDSTTAAPPPVSFVSVGTPAAAGTFTVAIEISAPEYVSGDVVTATDFCTIVVTDYGA